MRAKRQIKAAGIPPGQLLYDDWRHLYNHHRPHSALGYRPPAVFAAAFNKPELS